MNFFITVLSGISISFDMICVHLSATSSSFNTYIDYTILAIQILVLVYNAITVLGMFFNTFQNTSKILLFELLIRVFANTFYIVIAFKSLSNISILFYILSYLNIAFSIVRIISETGTREVVPSDSLTIVIESTIIQTDENCSICLDTLNNTEIYKTKCSHIFHTACMKKYAIYNFNEGIKCPICREVISKSSRTSIIFD